MVLERALSWQPYLQAEFSKPYMQKLKQFLQQEKNLGKHIYPKSEHWFHALEATPLDQVKVVILGQDPYHQPEQAHGLSFSVQSGVKIPPSLRNIYKELADDLNIAPASHGCLSSWAGQGVLLLNTVLTVAHDQAGSHQAQGWEQFTDAIIDLLNQQCSGLVFILWGTQAQKKAKQLDATKHLLLQSAHPSPLSSYRGFFASKPFSKVNAYLKQQGKTEINWQLPE